MVIEFIGGPLDGQRQDAALHGGDMAAAIEVPRSGRRARYRRGEAGEDRILFRFERWVDND